MPFCGTCGAQVEGRFCARCGSSVGAAAPAGAAGSAAPPPPTYQPVSAAGMTDNVASALCYALGLITGIIFLVLAPYNQNKSIRFHAFQSIFFHVACILFYVVLSVVLNIMLSMMHIFGLFFLTQLLGLGFFLVWLYLIISAYQGKNVELPIIGPIARQQA